VSKEDRKKWDKKYAQKEKLLELREPTLFVKKYYSIVNGKDALDLACGVGKDSIFLESRGFRVDAIDISKIALEKLKSYSKGTINIIEADLDNFTPKKEYDLIVKSNFLDRDLIERTKSSLKKGGIYIIETYIEDKDNEKRDSNPNFLLKKDELLKIFKDEFEILEYKTFSNNPIELYRMKKAAIVARRV